MIKDPSNPVVHTSTGTAVSVSSGSPIKTVHFSSALTPTSTSTSSSNINNTNNNTNNTVSNTLPTRSISGGIATFQSDLLRSNNNNSGKK